jgi:hypothetical protein
MQLPLEPNWALREQLQTQAQATVQFAPVLAPLAQRCCCAPPVDGVILAVGQREQAVNDAREPLKQGPALLQGEGHAHDVQGLLVLVRQTVVPQILGPSLEHEGSDVAQPGFLTLCACASTAQDAFFSGGPTSHQRWEQSLPSGTPANQYDAWRSGQLCMQRGAPASYV